MSNPFKTEEPWKPNTEDRTILAAGNYELTIEDAQDGTSSGKYPQIELLLSNEQGTIRDWIVITPNSIGRTVALADAAGVPVPEDEDIADQASFRLRPEWIYRLVGKKVGAVLRDEQRYGSSDPTDMVTRVRGYVHPSKLAEVSSDITPRANGGTSSKDLPF